MPARKTSMKNTPARKAPAKESKKTMNYNKATTSRSTGIVASRQSNQNITATKVVTYAETERFGIVFGTVANSFTVTGEAINPASAALFPWLGLHAALYDKYRFKKLQFRYKTSKGTTAPGNIMLAWDADPLDPRPDDAIGMSQSAVYADGAVWNEVVLNVPCDKEWRFTRTLLIPDTDQKTYDYGRLLMALEGHADTSKHGYIECSYVVELKHKQSVKSSRLPAFNNSYMSQLESSENISINNTIPLGVPIKFAAQPDVKMNPLQITPDLVNGGFTLPKGTYMVETLAEGLPNNADDSVFIDLLVDGVSAVTGVPGGPVKKIINAVNDVIVKPVLKSQDAATTIVNAGKLISFITGLF